MTLGEKLLNLTLEYKTALDYDGDEYAPITSRDPLEIAADYETTVLELVQAKAR